MNPIVFPLIALALSIFTVIIVIFHFQNITKYTVYSKNPDSEWTKITFDIEFQDRTNQFIVTYTIKYREKNARDHESFFIVEAFYGTIYFPMVDQTCRELFGTYNIADRLAVILKYRMMALKPD